MTTTAKKKYTILPVTRVEGHGKVTIHMDENNVVQEVRLHIVEFRGFERFILGPVTAPFREAAYLARTFAASYTNPTWGEVLGGLISKAVPTAITIGVWGALYAGHPLALAVALGISLALNIFHGIWINTWSNLQSNIGRQRGLQYQTIFNLAYGQWWGAVFRTVAWTAIPKTIPPWALSYWKDIGIVTLVGAFFGTLGIQGLNTLYDNGRLTRMQRGAIQQFRDMAMCLAGAFLGSGSMAVFWSMFAAQQGLDFLIYLASRRLKRVPILYVADEGVAGSSEFLEAYPVVPGRAEPESPLRQALKMLIDNPLVKPVVWVIKKIYSLLTKKK